MWCAHCVLHLTCTLFLNKMMILTQCAHCFVQIQHVEMTPCLWCAHCVLHLTRTIVFNQNDDIDSVCAMFCANWACWSAPCFVVCPLCFAPEGLTLRKWVDFTLNGCAHAVGWLHAGWVDLTPAPSTIDLGPFTFNPSVAATSRKKRMKWTNLKRQSLSEWSHVIS